MSRPRITLRIGRIIIDGPCRSPAALRRSLEHEIVALLSAPGARGRLEGGSVERLTAPLGLEGSGDRALGRGIARAAIGAMIKEGSR